MTVKVGINGFGRIGQQVLKAIGDLYPNDDGSGKGQKQLRKSRHMVRQRTGLLVSYSGSRGIDG